MTGEAEIVERLGIVQLSVGIAKGERCRLAKNTDIEVATGIQRKPFAGGWHIETAVIDIGQVDAPPSGQLKWIAGGQSHQNGQVNKKSNISYA